MFMENLVIERPVVEEVESERSLNSFAIEDEEYDENINEEVQEEE